MSERGQRLYLADIIESIKAIESFVAGMDRDTFAADRKTVSATVRELEVVGEAVKNVSDTIKSQYPDVLWKEIKAFRNMITHQYFGIDIRIVWDVVQNEIGTLKTQVEKILAELKE